MRDQHAPCVGGGAQPLIMPPLAGAAGPMSRADLLATPIGISSSRQNVPSTITQSLPAMASNTSVDRAEPGA